MTYESYLIYLLAVVVFFASPPDTSQLLVISNSISHGLRRSIFTIMGDLTANSLQIAAAAYGLGVIVSSHSTAFFWIKWFGVAYLLWIGFQVFRSRESSKNSGGKTSRPSSCNLFRQGFLTSLSNPFAIVFFGALFPQFIDPNALILLQVTILGATYLIVDGLILLLWGWVSIRATSRIRHFSSKLVNQSCGVILIAAAVLLAMKNFTTR